MVRVLVIEDDETVRSMLLCLLADAGHEAIGACDGCKGVATYRQAPTDLVITDIFMPEKDGLETIMELRRDFPDVKIIAVSGGGRSEATQYLHSAAEMGAERTLSKPFTPLELLSVVEEVLKAA
jgi:CheY-like chemotaxis protein